jgi:hypothetical protein
MKRVWLVGALSLAALACDPNTKSTDTVRNATASVADDGTVEDPGWTFTSIQLRVAVDEEGKLLEDGTAGEYGANILSGDLVPNVAKLGDVPTAGSEASVDVKCDVYDVKIVANGVECELTNASGLGPRYLCFSQARWDVQGDEVADCGFAGE